eukprot:scaffold133104_cov63-Phaeocystis_antarctica.AAC.4
MTACSHTCFLASALALVGSASSTSSVSARAAFGSRICCRHAARLLSSVRLSSAERQPTRSSAAEYCAAASSKRELR